MQLAAYEPHRDKTNKMACAPNEDSDQPGHPPSLIRVFTVGLKKARSLSYPLSAQRRLWSDWAGALADLSLRWAHMPFCWFCHDAAHIRFQESHVRDPTRPDIFCGDWNDFYDHSHPIADSSRTLVSYWQKYVHFVLSNCLGGLSQPGTAWVG